MKQLYTFILLFTSITLQAQINGTVKDSGGEPIPGANIFWMNSTGGVTTQPDGTFSIPRQDKEHKLVVSFIGFENDTIKVGKQQNNLAIVLREGLQLAEVSVVSRKMGTMKLRSSVLNEDMISGEELCRAACCNLGESFTTNPSVDVSYSDASTGANRLNYWGFREPMCRCLPRTFRTFAELPHPMDWATCRDHGCRAYR